MKVIILTSYRGFTRVQLMPAIDTAIDTCDGFQRFAEKAVPIESDGSCVCCKSLKAIASNNRSAYRTRVNPLLVAFRLGVKTNPTRLYFQPLRRKLKSEIVKSFEDNSVLYHHCGIKQIM